MREVVTEKIFSGEEDLIQISTEDRLWDLVEKMKRLEKYIPCVINDVAVIGIDKEQELFLQEQCSNIAVNLHGSPLKVGSIDPYKPENAICIQKDGMFLAYPGEYGYEIRPLISVGYISILKRLEMDCGASVAVIYGIAIVECKGEDGRHFRYKFDANSNSWKLERARVVYGFSSYATEELIEELVQRGYSVKMKLPAEIRFKNTIGGFNARN